MPSVVSSLTRRACAFLRGKPSGFPCDRGFSGKNAQLRKAYSEDASQVHRLASSLTLFEVALLPDFYSEWLMPRIFLPRYTLARSVSEDARR
jgi:hypothetical protein